MIATIPWRDVPIRVDLSRGRDLSITLDPGGAQPSFFAGAPARSEPLRAGDYVGSVREGGSCNAQILHFVPHCHGTHTECVGHLMPGADRVLDTIDTSPCLAKLVTLAPDTGTDQPELGATALAEALPGEVPAAALIVRTLPNGSDKRSRDYAATRPYPVFSGEAMQWLSRGHWAHLLIDTPSLDPAHDGGALVNHRAWWGLDGAAPDEARRRSVTEMIYVADDIPDGAYWLDLQLQPLAADAVASRPVVYPVVTT